MIVFLSGFVFFGAVVLAVGVEESGVCAVLGEGEGGDASEDAENCAKSSFSSIFVVAFSMLAGGRRDTRRCFFVACSTTSTVQEDYQL